MDAIEKVEIDDSHPVLIQAIDENAACANIQEAKKEAAEQGLIGTFVALRRTGNVFQRVLQQVASIVEPKNVEGFNEVKGD